MGIWPVYGIHLLKASEKLDLGIFEKEGQRSSQTFRYKNQVKAGGQQAPKHVSQQRRGDHECVVLGACALGRASEAKRYRAAEMEDTTTEGGRWRMPLASSTVTSTASSYIQVGTPPRTSSARGDR
ncbi:hypothetical protein GQ600_13049 [Phytophthora cactorum]|nr:hypothetical protein GQ600_13033 [Phytophthora cactorum]KAF1773750.1 hypothetical protein GQ600_13049 [Phytophthora cactorum]